MERYHVKRLPALANGRMVGIISRADLMREMALRMRLEVEASPGPDWWIRGEILAALGKNRWAPDIKVEVKSGIVELSGVITDDRERQGLIVMAENVPGVKKGPRSSRLGRADVSDGFPVAEDEAKEKAAAS